MPPAPRPLPASLRHAVFSTQEALSLGIDVTRLRRDDLRSLAPGFWARRDRVVTEREIVGAPCRKDPRAFAAGLTAARLWGFPLPGSLAEQVVEAPTGVRASIGRPGRGPGRKRIDRRIHMARPGSQRRATALLRWSRFDGDVMRLGDGRGEAPTVRLTSRMQTFLHLGAVLRVDSLIAIGDHLVRRPRPAFEGRSAPYATIAELTESAARFSGRGATRLREAVAQVRMSSDSPPETALRLAMVAAGLPEPLANARAIQRDADGTLLDLGEPDLHWPQWKVALEHEGPTHLDRRQQAKDISHGDRRLAAGWVELRTTADDLRDGCGSAVRKARRELLRSGWRPEPGREQ
jgi:hypothetical protein